MAELIQRLFKVQSGEGNKVFLFAVLSGFLQVGVAIGMSAADSLFLVYVGSGKLPYIYVVMPFVMLVYTSITSYLTSRYGVDRVFDLTLALVGVGSVGLTMLLQYQHAAVYYLVKVYAGLWFIGLYTLFWNFTDCYFDIQDAKRLFPLFSGGASTGAMVGGTLVSVASRHVQVETLFLVWGGLALATFPLVVIVRRRFAKIEIDEDAEQRNFLQEVRVTAGTIGRSPYTRLLVIVMFTALLLTTILEFQYSSIFERGRSEKQLAALLGSLYAWVNVFNLVVNCFLFNRLVLSFGVGNFAVVTPVVYLATFLFLLFNHGFPAGVLGFFAYQGILTSIDWNNTNFLFNAVPAGVKKQVRTVAEGLCEPLASATAGVFLLLFGTKLGYTWITRRPSQGEIALLSPEGISAIGAAIGGLYLLIAVALRASYLRSMVANLKREWLDFSRPARLEASALDEEQLRILEQRSRSEDPEVMATAIRLLWIGDRRRALDRVLEILGSDDAAMAAQPLLSMMLQEEDYEVVRVVLDWLDRAECGGAPPGPLPVDEQRPAGSQEPGARRSLSPALLQELAHHGLIAPRDVAHLLASRDPEERAAAAVAAWNSWNITDRALALQVVSALLAGSAEERVAAVGALGRSRQERSAYALAPYLQDADRRVRHEALSALARLVTRESTRLMPEILRAIERGDARERLIGMQALARIGDADCVAPLLAASDSFTPIEQRACEGVLCGIGLKSVPTTVAVLRDPAYPYRARGVAARALARTAFPQLEALSPGLIRAELQRAYRYLCYQEVLEGQPGARTTAVPSQRAQAPSLRVATGPSGGAAFAPRRVSTPEDGFARRCPPEPERSDHGLLVLSRFYGDLKVTIVDFVLELLTLGGRLPDFELMSASLRSGNRRERANALETIEQGTSREVFRMLLPLVAGETATQGREAKRAFPRPCAELPRPCLGDLLREAVQSRYPLESAAAAQALWESEGAGTAEVLRARLRQAASPLFRETFLSLLSLRNSVTGDVRAARLHRTRAHDGGEVSSPATLVKNPIETLGGLVRAPFFREFTMRDLEVIARCAFPVEFPPGAPVYGAGDPSDALFVVTEGQAAAHARGDVFGEEGLFGRPTRGECVHSEGLKAIRIPTAAVIAAAERYPRVGVALLRQRSEEPGGHAC
jgi:hypothetical protein